MALFGSARDASMIRSINRELINRYIDMEVGFYKLNLQATNTNIYDESDNKVYYDLIRINAIILKDTKTTQSDDYGIDYIRNGTFAFLRDDLIPRSIVIEVGDIIEYDGEYFEVDNTSSTQYFRGTNPEQDLGYDLGLRAEFGWPVSVVVDTHVTRKNRLNIQSFRSGINKPNNIPRNL
jgi:hypothetical protein